MNNLQSGILGSPEFKHKVIDLKDPDFIAATRRYRL